MTKYSKYNLVYRIQKWMDTVSGQTFLNYAYSFGAAIVILGALFKLTHLPGANIMLFVGMGTEVFVFIISAFDRPFDKTAEGRELPTHLTEDIFEEEDGKVAMQTYSPATDVPNGEPVCSGGQSTAVPVSAGEVSQMAEAQNRYTEVLHDLVDTMSRLNAQSQHLVQDSDEMENLNRTLTGISKVYEMQLKSASQQMSTIDQINEQSKKLAQQMEQLNSIYARMIQAMTVNMRAGAQGMSTANETL